MSWAAQTLTRSAALIFKAEAAAERLGKLVAAIAPADFA